MNERIPDNTFDSESHNRAQFVSRLGNKTLAASMGALWGASFTEAINGAVDLIKGHTIFDYASPKEQAIALGVGIAYGAVGFGGFVYKDLTKKDNLDTANNNPGPPQAE